MVSHVCEKCKRNKVTNDGEWCKPCRYQEMVSYTLSMEPEDQEWEFAHCDECGSSLDSNGQCPNTSCGASPRCGEDWY